VLCLLNIRSLKKVNSTNSKACDLLSNDCKSYNVDVCIVIETFLKPRIPDTFIHMDGYSTYRRDRKICACRKANCGKPHGGGGILVYVRSSINCEIYSVAEDSESMWLKMLTNSQCSLFLNVSYAPPGSDKASINRLNNYISAKAEEIYKTFPKPIIFVAGDFNRMCLDDIEFACCVTPLASPPTRGDALLDIILTNKPDLIEKVECFNPSVETDHNAVIVLPRKKTLPDRYVCTFRLFTARGHSKLSSSLKKTNYNEICDPDVNRAAEALEGLIKRIVEESFPLRKVVMSTKDPTWLTPKTKWLLLKKKQARRRGQNRRAEKIDRRLKDAKLKKESKNSTKQWWEKIDSITHRKLSSKSIDYGAFDPEELNLQLAQRCSLVDENEPRTPTPLFDTTNARCPEITLPEVSYAMKSCKRTASGPSDIPDFVFREHWEILAPLYLHVWNLSIRQGIFPQCYKRADIVPLPKVKNAKCSQHVRGISVTPIAARLLERIVHRRWISDNILLRGDPLQFAYKRNLSTLDYLLFLQFFILSQLDKKTIDGVHVIAVDFSKAFDCVDQELAAQTYEEFIDSPYIRRWLYNFTIDREQRLVWRNKKCGYHPINRGCSQGTVGGPGIFSMLTDDGTSSNKQCAVVKYSDDMSCIIPCLKQPNEAERKIVQTEFDSFSRWVSQKKLKINTEKTRQIRFSLNPSPTSFCNCEPVNVSCASELRILGITFQRNFLFSKHAKALLSHLRSLLYLLKDLHLRHIPIHEINRLFESVILSRIRYGISVYGGDLGALKKVDAFLEKCYNKHYSSKRIFAQDLLQEEDKRLLQNIITNRCHPLRPYILSHQKPKTSTRHNFLGVKPKTKNKLFLHSFCNRILT